jgi:hypothetical protein
MKDTIFDIRYSTSTTIHGAATCVHSKDTDQDAKRVVADRYYQYGYRYGYGSLYRWRVPAQWEIHSPQHKDGRRWSFAW